MKTCDRPGCDEPYEIALGVVLAADSWSHEHDVLEAIAEDRAPKPVRVTWYVFCRRHARRQWHEMKRQHRTITYRERTRT